MKKNVWIMNHYASHMFFDDGGRHYFFSKYLKKAGYNPVVFCANMRGNKTDEKYFKTNDLFVERTNDQIDVPFVFVKVKLYLHNGFRRIINMLSFYHNLIRVGKKYAKQHNRPDIILASSVHPLTLIAGQKLAKYFGIKCICEMRDLWPEAIVSYSKRIKKNGIIASFLYSQEKRIYKNADALIFTQEGGRDYIIEKKWDTNNGGPIKLEKVFHINNGVDLESFEYNKEHFKINDTDLNDKRKFKAVYCGSIRRINNLGIILDAAKLIKNKNIIFLIYGDGDELSSLKKRVLEEKIDNVVFKGRIGKKCVPYVDSMADLNIVHWEMSPLLRVGESYNKAFEYFAAGKPVFYTVRPNYSIVEKYNCGRITEGFKPSDLAVGIERMSDFTIKQ